MKLERRVEISWRDTIYVRDHGLDEYILTENRERVREVVEGIQVFADLGSSIPVLNQDEVAHELVKLMTYEVLKSQFGY